MQSSPVLSLFTVWRTDAAMIRRFPHQFQRQTELCSPNVYRTCCKGSAPLPGDISRSKLGTMIGANIYSSSTAAGQILIRWQHHVHVIIFMSSSFSPPSVLERLEGFVLPPVCLSTFRHHKTGRTEPLDNGRPSKRCLLQTPTCQGDSCLLTLLSCSRSGFRGQHGRTKGYQH